MRLVVTQKGIILDYDELVRQITAPKVTQMLNCLSFINRRQSGRRVLYGKAHFYKIISLPNGNKLLSIARSAYFQDYRGFRKFLPDQVIINKLPPGDSIARDKFPTEEEFMIYEFQQVVHDYVMKNIFNAEQVKKGNAGVTLVMDTGLGKSYLAAAFFRTLGLKTLYVTANLGLVQQMREKPFNMFPKIKIGEYHSKKKEDGDIVFTTPQSVQKEEFKFGRGKYKNVIKSQDYLKTFGFVIFDETPEYLGDISRNLYWKTNCKYMLGLTATPDEHVDKMDIIYKLHIGPLLNTATDIPGFNIKDVIWKVKVKAIKYYGPPEHTKRLLGKTNELNTHLMDDQFAADPHRRKMVLSLVKQLYNAGKNIFIFANQRKHLESLYEDIISYGIVAVIDDPDDANPAAPKDPASEDQASKDPLFIEDPNIESVGSFSSVGSVGNSIVKNPEEPTDVPKNPKDVPKDVPKNPKDVPKDVPKNDRVKTLMGGSTRQDVETAEKKSSIILTTYRYGSVGMSIIKMDVIVLYTPRKAKMKQIMGRILRRGGDPKSTRYVIDIIDANTSLVNQYSVRKKTYIDKGFNIAEKKVYARKKEIAKEIAKETAKENPQKEKSS